MSKPYLRGDMYYADLGQGIGSEQKGHRPVVIIQNNTGNKHSPTVIVAAISSKAGVKPKLPTHYFINAECGLKLPSIRPLAKLSRAIKIANTSNQRKAEGKAFSTIAVTL